MKEAVGWIWTNDQNQILVQRKTDDYPRFPGGVWVLPGAYMRLDESPIETYNRGAKNEFGIVPDAKQVFEYLYQQANEEDYRNYFFEARLNWEEIRSMKFPQQGNGSVFFSLEYIMKLPDCPKQEKEIIEIWKSLQ